MFKRFLRLLLAVAFLDAASPAFTTHYEVQRFADCNAASFYAADHPLVGLFSYRLQAQYAGTSITPSGSLGFRATTRVRYALDPNHSQMSLPKWSWRKMTASQQVDLLDFVSALRNHEIGHVEIAQHGIAGRESTITVLAATPAQAKSRLAAAGSDQLRTLYAEILQAEKTYDRVTSHGMQQRDGPAYGFRGGPNVEFGCR
jgi:hypothetical protein